MKPQLQTDRRCRRPNNRTAFFRLFGKVFSCHPGYNGKAVVLIHGWGVRAGSMGALARMLNRCGYTVFNYDYPSSLNNISGHAERFLARWRSEVYPPRCSFVTHSMGGLILRRALAGMTETECRAIDAAVMLGPPNRGSLLALPGKLGIVGAFNRSLGDMIPGGSALEIPPPPYLPPIGIIAGTFDGKVPLDSTSLPDGLPFQRVTVNCTHPGLRDPVRTGPLIKKFLRYKHF